MAGGQLRTILRHLALEVRHEGDLTDRQLLQRFAARRDEDAFAALVGRHGPLVLGVSRRVLGQAQDAEDVFQATFLVLAKRAGSVRWRESVANWLYGVAYRLAREARSATVRRRRRESQAASVPRADTPPEAA
jgi:RNA polymerase sigma factor (sigma-70 family)